MRAWIILLVVALLGAGLSAGRARADAPAPAWAATITDSYVGREWNAGVMACARTEFSLRGSALVGHYWIGDKEPFEGDLTDFVPTDAHSGTFTWTDRYGEGAFYVRFAEDGLSFYSLWGEQVPDPNRPGYGLRGAEASVPGCNNATS
jgi:hypothetical protein